MVLESHAVFFMKISNFLSAIAVIPLTVNKIASSGVLVRYTGRFRYSGCRYIRRCLYMAKDVIYWFNYPILKPQLEDFSKKIKCPKTPGKNARFWQMHLVRCPKIGRKSLLAKTATREGRIKERSLSEVVPFCCTIPSRPRHGILI